MNSGRAILFGLILCTHGMPAFAQESGLSPNRVRLPAGPGTIDGLGDNAEVDGNMGLLGYEVPLEIPAGQAGLRPELKLRYQSGAGNGEVGIGWSMRVGSIERMVSYGTPRYDRSDRFAADGGTELVAVDARTGVYRARYEGGFVRYTWLDADDGRRGGWRAEYPDGRVSYFGIDANRTAVAEALTEGAAGVFRYHLVMTVDPHGHTVRYRYTRDGAHALPLSASWGSATPEGRYELRLEYERRPDPISDGRAGVDLRQALRVRNLVVRVRGAQLRRYQLSYEPAETTGGLSRLARVETFGVGDAGPYPVRFSFGYSRALPCEGNGCEPPTMRSLGRLGLDLRARTADFIDLNGDGLPDVLDTGGSGHALHVLARRADGGERYETPSASRVALGMGLRLDNPRAQLVDLNGDGFTDLIDGANRRVLWNRGGGDWAEAVSVADTGLPDLSADAEMRFFDWDGDRRIDLLHSDRGATWYLRNRGDGTFETRSTLGDLLGWSFRDDALRLADMNGDGALDAVRAFDDGLVWRPYLGLGRWGNTVSMSGLPPGLPATEWMFADLNGDGLADLVVVQADRVSYALNRSGVSFDPLRAVRQAAGGAVPLRTPEMSVRLLDMDGNGTTDVVWVDPSGAVSYLSLFEQRPHLLTSIANGIGRTTDVIYGNSVSEMARDGAAMWAYRVPFAMQVVARVRDTDAWSGVVQTREFRYRDGYYDGGEGQFRGFARVEVAFAGDATSQPGRELREFDVGAQDRYRKGLALRTTTESEGRVIEVVARTWEDCAVAEATGAVPAVRFLCETRLRRTVQEGRPAAEWVLVGEDYSYDGYGNRTRTVQHGVLSVGGGACEACARAPTVFGRPCGMTCLGDERTAETDFVSPAQTGGRWMLRSVAHRRTRGRSDTAEVAEERTYYDGEPFAGLPLGRLVRGDVTRVEARVSADRWIDRQRNRVDAHGNVVETRDGNGRRRAFDYDADGVLVVAERWFMDDRTRPVPYALRFAVGYHPVHEKVERVDDWSVEGATSPTRSTRYGYDPFGRMVAAARPGDSLEAPTERWTFELGARGGRIVRRAASRQGGAVDVEEMQCVDSLGRTVQRRARVAEGRYRVTEAVGFDVRGQTARRYQPWEDPSDACAPPMASVRVTTERFDATGRALGTTLPDGDLYPTASQTRVEFGPLTETLWDEEDLDASSARRDTPRRRVRDGLGRLVLEERRLDADRVLRTEFRFDSLGHRRGFVDPTGREKVQTHDLLGRVLRVEDPEAGAITYEYDDADNRVRRVDARGVATRTAYDEANRRTAVWDEARAVETRIEYRYDRASMCEAARCSHLEGRVASIEYPGSQGRNAEVYGYDARGMEVYLRRSIEGRSFELGTARDNLGRIVGRRYPQGRTVDFALDGLGRITSASGLASRVQWDDRGDLAAVVMANGVEQRWRHDARQRLAGAQAVAGPTTLHALAFRYDRAGLVTAVEDSVAAEGAPSESARFEHDALERLTGATLDVGRTGATSLRWDYDLGGNITAASRSVGNGAPSTERSVYGMTPGGVSYGLIRRGDVEMAHDRAGVLTRRGDTELSSDLLGRITAERRGSAAVTAVYGAGYARLLTRDDGSVHYHVDDDYDVIDGVSRVSLVLEGRRVLLSEAPDGAGAVLGDLAPLSSASPDATPQPDGELHASDAWVAHARSRGYVRAAGIDESPTALLAAAAQRLLTGNGGVRGLHANQVGTVVAVTGPDGRVETRQGFTPFGLRRYGARTSGEPGFMGAAHEDAMGLIAIGARTLDPASGRWTAPDPLFEWMVETPAGEESAGAESRPGYAEFGGLRVASRGDALMLATGALWREGALAGLQSHEALRRYELSLGNPATRADPSGLVSFAEIRQAWANVNNDLAAGNAVRLVAGAALVVAGGAAILSIGTVGAVVGGAALAFGGNKLIDSAIDRLTTAVATEIVAQSAPASAAPDAQASTPRP